MNDIYICGLCNYRTKRKNDYDKHLKTNKHTFVDEYFCDVCKYSTNNKGNYHKHLNTKKHKNRVVKNESINEKEMDQLTKKDLLGIINELIPKVGTNITNNISIQVFLDDKCKDAMTIQNFTTQLTLTIEDLLEHKKNGLASGMSNVLIKNLKPIPITERPIHCMDEKNKKWMINDELIGWTPDDGNKLMNQAGSGINKKFQDLWEKAYPNWKSSEELKESWLELVRCLNADYSDKDIMTTLKKLGPECKLSLDDVKAIL